MLLDLPTLPSGPGCRVDAGLYELVRPARPERAPAGHRCYDGHHIELLSFIGRAKGFGLSLEEITELVRLLDEDRCALVYGGTMSCHGERRAARDPTKRQSDP